LPQTGPCVGASGLDYGGTAGSGHGHESFSEHVPILRVQEADASGGTEACDQCPWHL